MLRSSRHKGQPSPWLGTFSGLQKGVLLRNLSQAVTDGSYWHLFE